jgi:NADH:ubiquinone oxidoreductase subunit 3 (subunit A)
VFSHIDAVILLPLNQACVINMPRIWDKIHKSNSKERSEEPQVQNDWYFIVLFVVISPILAAAPMLINYLLGPKKPNAIKQQTYECGIETVGDAWVQFKVQYYIYALVFVIFDIEAVFLFPVAAAYGQLDLFAIGATV